MLARFREATAVACGLMAPSKRCTAMWLSLNALGFRDGGGGVMANVTGETKTAELSLKVA